ncbi:hypothetical protein RCL1_006924 [Eukaryota sp. TZLM3-RCL]
MSDTLDQLINVLKAEGALQSHRVEAAMRAVDRRDFCTSTTRALAYADTPLPIGHDQTISAPHMHAFMLEKLLPGLHEGAIVLDVGSGSGILSAYMAILVGPSGRVYGIEAQPDLVPFSKQNIAKYPEIAKRIEIVHGDGWKGLPSAAPFDCIHVGAGASKIPQPLIQQLRTDGLMVIPVGTGLFGQRLKIVRKRSDGHIEEENSLAVAFVPLVSQDDV